MSEQIGIRIDDESFAKLKEQAEQRGVSSVGKLIQDIVADHLRSGVEATVAAPDTIKLLRHAIYILTRLHVGMYAIPEKHGQMTTEQLREVFEMTRGSAREYMLGLDKHIAKTLED